MDIEVMSRAGVSGGQEYGAGMKEALCGNN